ncbi:hypothetical protein DFH27DRAFT_478253 [Peziza echinospora]|nr:hypothetical protein DFH27DRAFT_478253 [Peziza echinospora]
MKLEPHQVIDQRSELVAEWGIYWYLPVLAIAAFVAGLVGALGHHAFYRSLHGQESREQLMMVRIGTAFAFFVKACLVGAVVLAYRQRIWYTMRRKALSIRTIDAMFGVVEDPTFFFTAPQMVKKSKVSSLLALATWLHRLIPIASVLSPSSLTSDLIHVKRDTSCSVPTVDFPAENKYDYRTAQADFGNALSFYNHTDPDDRDSDLAYDMPSFMNLLVASKSVFNHGIVAPNTTPCPKSNNCTFAIVIDAPGYKCDDLIGQTPIWQRAPFNMDTLVPDGRFVYRAEVDQGDFQKPDLRPKDPNFDPEWITGTFHYEPELWIAFATRTNESLPEEERQKYKYTLKNGTTINRWQYRFERRMFRCVLHYTTYKLNFEYLNNKQNITILSTNYTRPVMETVYGENPPNRSKFMRPSNENYRLTAAYHSIAQLMRAYLRGAIYQDNDAANTEGSIPITNSTISLTNLVESETAYPVKDLDKKIQKFLQDIIFTLLTHPKKMVVTKHIQVPCMASFYQNRFQYHEKNLWIGYSIVVVGTFISIIIGGVALRSNGISSDTLFSRILVTTRNPTLDRLCRGACLGGDPFPKELEQTKLRFGVLRDTDPFTGALMESRKSLGARGLPEHCSFGTIYETSDIVKGERYAGLRNIGGRERQDCNGCGRCENGGEEDFRGEFLVEEEGGEFDEKSRQNYMDEEEEEMFYDFEGGERGSLDGADDSVETIPLLAQLR